MTKSPYAKVFFLRDEFLLEKFLTQKLGKVLLCLDLQTIEFSTDTL